jgi:hypothetical protein
VRDRSDGRGVNIGFEFEAGVIYGDRDAVRLHESDGFFRIIIPGETIVSQGDFVVANVEPGFQEAGPFAYYPGIVADQPGVVLPIQDIFPDLTSINFDGVSDLYAVDGYIYMTLHGDNGLYLFGARDPSVIPEPSTLLIAALATGAIACCRRTILRSQLATFSRR